jgi:tetratricopeptide (TPR) repeat protein
MNVQQMMTQAKQRHAAGDLRAAEPLYRQVLAAEPNHPEALNMLGLLALQCGQPQAAIELMERSVGASAGVFFFHNNLAEAYKAAGRYADAAAAFERSLQLKPGDVETAHSLGVALEKAGEADRAIDVLRDVIARAPQMAKAHMSLGAVLEHRARYDEALALFERAVAIKPDYAKARAARAGIWLRNGDFARGWDEYEWRWRVDKFPGRPPRAGVPIWDGGELGGRRVLVFAEQGLGDTIQFIRYAPLVAARGGRVIVECPRPLVRLARTVEGVGDVAAAEDPSPAYDVQVPLLSLPRILGTRVETIPSRVPYVAAPPETVDKWRTKIDGQGGLKVGLCWAGGRSQPHRTMAATEVARLVASAPPGVRFVS